MPGLKKSIVFILLMGVIGLLAAITPTMFALEEKIGLDLLFQLRGPRQPPANVVVVALDRQSSKQMNLPMQPRKWPRTVHARLIDRLKMAGAKVIVFDIIFNETQSAETDQALADAIGRAGNVILTQSLIDETMPVTDQSGLAKAYINIEKIVPPIDLLAQAALAQAPFAVPKVPIKLSRFWTFKPSAGDVPAMPVMAFHAYARQAFCILQAAVQEEFRGIPENTSKTCMSTKEWRNAIEMLRVHFQKQPPSQAEIDAIVQDQAPSIANQQRSLIQLYSQDNSRYIDFYGPAQTLPTIAYHRLMALPESSLEQLNLRDKTVFVGQTESYWPKAKDGFYTVYADETAVDISGVEIAATAFANLLENRSVTPLTLPMHLLLLTLWGILAATVSIRLPTPLSTGTILAGAGLYLAFAHIVFSRSGTWYPIVAPLFCLSPMAYFSAVTWRYIITSGERRTIREAFGYYLPNHVVDQLSRNVQSIRSQRQQLYSICLFTDAGNYTRLSESMDPDSLTSLMNQYYEAIFKPIRAHDGVVLQVVGDAVLALWTAPAPDPLLRRKACLAALDIADAVAQFNQRPDTQQLPTRIGMHAGQVVLGNIGAMDHFEYRPVGDIVNTASRMEGLNKKLQTGILASEVTVENIEGIATRYVGKFVFAGKSTAIRAYELLCADAFEAPAHKAASQAFAQALHLFEQQLWQAAHVAFEEVLAIDPSHGPSRFYCDWCRRYQQTPPEAPWDGAIHLRQK